MEQLCWVLKYQSIMLVERAAEKPSMLKLISVAVQRAKPAMTGNRDRFTHTPAYTKKAHIVKRDTTFITHVVMSL